jgi:hypothetical protein
MINIYNNYNHMNRIIETLESNYFNIFNIIMIFIDIDKPNLIDIHNYLIRNIRIDLIKNNNILGKDILEFKYRNRQCDIMILNNNVIITLFPIK